MAITVRSSNGYIEYDSGASNTSHTINISDAAVGDLRLLHCNWSPDGTGTLPSHPTITGWTQIGTSTATGAASNSRLSLYYRVVQSGDTLTSATVGVTLSNTAWAKCNAITLEGVDTTTPLDQTVPSMNTGSGTTIPCPAITTQTDGAYVGHVAIQDGSSNMADGDEPGTDTLHGTQYSNPPSNGASIGSSYLIESTATTSPAASWNTGVSEEYVGATFAIRPSTGASVHADEFPMDDPVTITLTGTGFDASGNTVYLSDQETTGSTYEVDVSSSINSESTTEIKLVLAQLGAEELAGLQNLGPGQRYFIIDASGGEVPSDVVTVHRPEAFEMALSSNFAPGSTTAQLTAPLGKTTGDMDGGRIEEANNPSGTTTNVTVDDYREDEWCFSQKPNIRQVSYEFRATVDGSAYGTYTETPALNLVEESGIKVRVANFSLRTTTGTQDITIADLGSASSIKGAIFFTSGATALDTVDTCARQSIAFTDKTTTIQVNTWMEDGQTASDTRRNHTQQILRINDKTTQATVTTATVDSWITDGVRISVTQNTSEAYKGHVIFFTDSGSDLSVKVVTPQMSTTSTVDVTTVGFEPEAVIAMSYGGVFIGTATSDRRFTFGVATNPDGTNQGPQFSLAHDSDLAQNPVVAASYFSDTSVGHRLNNATSTHHQVSIDSWDSSGFSLTPTADASTTYHDFFCISTNGKAKIGVSSFTGPVSAASDWQNVGTSIKPQAVIGAQSAITTINTLSTTDEISVSYFAFDKDGGQGLIGQGDDDGVTPSNTFSIASTTNNLWVRKDDQSGDFHLAGDPSIIPGGYEYPAVEITTADGTARYGFVLVVGEVISPVGISASLDTPGVLSLTGIAADLEISTTLSLTLDTPGVVALTGQTADQVISDNIVFELDTPGVVALTGQTADQVISDNVSFELGVPGVLALTGQSADQVVTTTPAVFELDTPGVLLLTGLSADQVITSTAAEYELNVPGVIALTGLTADYVQTTNIDLTLDSPGVLTFTGLSADQLITEGVPFELSSPGVLTLTGLLADYERTTNLDLSLDSPGVFVVTGNTPDVQITAEILDLTLDTPGILTFTGLQADVSITTTLSEYELDTPGVLALTGVQADVDIVTEIDLTLDNPGVLTLTGLQGDTELTTNIDASLDVPGVVTCTGLQADLEVTTNIDVTLDDPGVLTFSGLAADIVVSQDFAFEAVAGSLLLYGQKASVIYPGSEVLIRKVEGGVRGKASRSRYPRRVKIGDKWFYAKSLGEEKSLVEDYYKELKNKRKKSVATKRKIKGAEVRLKKLEKSNRTRIRNQNIILLNEFGDL